MLKFLKILINFCKKFSEIMIQFINLHIDKLTQVFLDI